MIWMIIRTMLALALVLSLGWVVLRGMQRRVQSQAASDLERLSSLTLTPKRQIQLVRIGQQVWALGYHEQGMTVIGTIPREDLVATMATEAPSPDWSFRDLLNTLSKQRWPIRNREDHD